MKPLLRDVLSLPLSLALVACGGSGGGGRDDAGGGGGTGGSAFADARLAQCVRESPLLQVGAGRDAPGRAEIDVSAGPQPASACRENTQFRFGSGIYDITGVIANNTGMGYEDPMHILGGIHTRQHARAYVIESPCNGKRIVFVSTDTGMVFGAVRQGVLDAFAADPELSQFYGPDNAMFTATHTHAGPSGYSHYNAHNFFHLGFDATTYNAITNGIVEAVRRAHASLQVHPQAAPIRLAVGELLNTNLNRSRAAFLQNPEAERRQFLNSRGEEVDVDKRFVQLNLVRGSTAVGVINWFGVHPTSVGQTTHLASSDNKGYASLGFERIMRTRYDAPVGTDTFVAAFAQTDEGDSSPNIFVLEHPAPDPARGGGATDYESSAISGTKQLNKALELFTQGRPLSGPVDYRTLNVAMDAVEVTDPVVLAGLQHPPELDANPKRTCVAALGVSFGAGAEDGPGPTVEGVSCKSAPDVIAAAQADFEAFAAGKIPPNLFATAVGCQLDQLPGVDLACQAEKPVLFVVGPPLNAEPNVLPLQLFRIGNFALVGIPMEVTTMAARRIRKTLLDVLAPVGVDTIVVAGLANDFVHYLTTREEYAIQHYEGASTLFGPWQLAAVQQETRKLALALRDGQPAPAGPAIPRTPMFSMSTRPPYVPSDLPGPGGFGALLADAPATAARGETVRASFQAGHPRNDLKIQSSYVFVERKRADGSWEVVAQDRDPELLFTWLPQTGQLTPIDVVTGPSTAEAVWTIPRDTPAGTYRLRHAGVAQTTPLLPAQAYEGVSREFTIGGMPATCP
ncbi:MAG TPA: neutral/alkaline non-lysosomal ceramidase N-terminal domain-containing protein [Nevskiales bacterium]|nr:neutral/alkaline non-lysosomal ceramidase N-terminal domain-containing protein [Nevskiales bacterium]